MSDTPPITPPAAPPATPPAPPAPTPPGGDGGGDEKTFTQADLDRHAGRVRSEATKAAERKLAEDLGVPIDQAKKLIADAKAAEDAAKTDAERLRDGAAAAKTQAEQDRAAAAAEKFAAKLERRLASAGVGAGIEDEAQAAAVMARALRVVNLAADASDDDITAEIDQLKADIPGLFGTQVPAPACGQPATVPSGVTPGKPPAGGQQPATGMDAGRARAKAGRSTDPPADPFARWAKPA